MNLVFANEISDRVPAEQHIEKLLAALFGRTGGDRKVDCRVKYTIISSGSQGNAVILNDFVLVDCGVPYKQIAPYVSQLKLVLLTHIHS